MDKGISSNLIKIIILVLLFVAVIIYFLMDIFSIENPVPASADASGLALVSVLKEFDAQSRSSVYASDKGGYFFITKDGIKYYGKDGREAQSGLFNTSEPIVAGRGNVVGIWEFRGSAVYVFSDKGELHTHQTDNPIIHLSVNALGYCSFITQEKDAYRLYVYDAGGLKLKEGIFTTQNVFPMSSALSDDGKYLAVSFLDINGVNMNSQVAYSSLKSNDSIEYTDTVFASSVINTGEIITKLEFVDNKLVIVSDKRVKCVDMSDPSKDKWSIDLYNKLDGICFNGSSGFAVALGEEIINKPSESPGLVKYYVLNDGDFLWDYQTSARNRVSLMSSGFGSLIIGSGRNFTALTEKGKTIWSINPMESVTQMFFMGDINNIIQVSQTKASTYKLGPQAETPKASPETNTETIPDDNNTTTPDDNTETISDDTTEADQRETEE